MLGYNWLTSRPNVVDQKFHISLKHFLGELQGVDNAKTSSYKRIIHVPKPLLIANNA